MGPSGADICADSLTAVSGLSHAEAVAWCWRLTQECCSEGRYVEHCWQRHDLLIIDNFAILHARVGCMHRGSKRGPCPIAHEELTALRVCALIPIQVKYAEQAQRRLLYRLRLDADPEGDTV